MKFLITKDMYVRLRDFNETLEIARCSNDDLILCVSGAYRMVDGKPVVVELSDVGRPFKNPQAGNRCGGSVEVAGESPGRAEEA